MSGGRNFTLSETARFNALLAEAIVLNEQSPTFSRAGTAYDPRTNQTVALGVRRRMKLLGDFEGDLLEPAATNVCLQSETLGNAAWVGTNMTVTADDFPTPSGGASTADRLAATAANATLLQTITVSTSYYTLSCWMRRRTGTGVVSLVLGGTTTAITISSQWSRVTLPVSLTAGSITFGFQIATSGDEIQVGQVQLEATGYATSYIGPTTTGSVSRVADSFNVSSYNVRRDALTHLIVVRPLYWDAVQYLMPTANFALGPSTGSPQIYTDSTHATLRLWGSGPAGGFSNAGSTIRRGQSFCAAVAWAVGSGQVAYLNGTAFSTYGSLASPNGVESSMTFGASGNAYTLCLHWPRQLSASEIQLIAKGGNFA